MRPTLLLLVAFAGCSPIGGTSAPRGTGSLVGGPTGVGTAPPTGTAPFVPTAGTIVPGCGVLQSVGTLASAGHEWATNLVAYPDGGFALAGYFRETLVVDAGGPAEATLTAYGDDNDGLLLRYGPAGDVLWARQLGNAKVRDLAAAPDGGLVVAGWFDETARFALGQPDEVQLVTSGSNDGFVARFDAAGALSWLAPVVGSAWQLADTVDLVDEDDLLVTGHFEIDATLSAAALAAVPGTEFNVFVARLSGADASVVWAESFGGATDISVERAAYDAPAGELVLAGQIVGPGEVVLPGGDVLRADQGRSWMAGWSEDGGATWAYGTTAFPAAIEVADDGTLLVAGSFSDDVVLGAGEPNETLLHSDVAFEVYLASFAPDRTLAWAVQSTTVEGYAGATALVATDDGGVVLAGGFEQGTELGGVTVESTDGGVFLARLDDAGTVTCVTTIESSDAGLLSMAAQSPGLVVGTGFFNDGDATFAPGTAEEATVPNLGSGDGFLGIWSF